MRQQPVRPPTSNVAVAVPGAPLTSVTVTVTLQLPLARPVMSTSLELPLPVVRVVVVLVPLRVMILPPHTTTKAVVQGGLLQVLALALMTAGLPAEAPLVVDI